MNLHVESEGDGAPVLFLHGVSGAGATYRWLTLEHRRIWEWLLEPLLATAKRI